MISILAATVGYITLFVSCAAATVSLMRRSAAASRHLVWSAAIGGSVLVPILLFLGTMGVFQPLGIVRPIVRVDWPFFIPPLSFEMRGAVLSLWLIAGAAAMLRAVVASAAVRWRAMRSERVHGAHWQELEQAAADTLGVSRAVSIRRGAGDIPFTIGVLQPSICLPAHAAEWPRERARLVLLHELAHIARYDVATQFVERLALVLFWFHPLMWLAVRAARRERERACDDLVVAASAKPVEYAATLLALASEDGGKTRGRLAIGAGDVETRITAILNSSTPRGALRVRHAIAAVSAVAALGLTSILFGAGPAARMSSSCNLGLEPSLAEFRDAGAYHRITRLRGCTELVAFGGAELRSDGTFGKLPPGSRVLMQTVMPELTRRVDVRPESITCRTNLQPAPASECRAAIEDALNAYRRYRELFPAAQ